MLKEDKEVRNISLVNAKENIEELGTLTLPGASITEGRVGQLTQNLTDFQSKDPAIDFMLEGLRFTAGYVSYKCRKYDKN